MNKKKKLSLKEMQALELMIAKEVKRVCEENDIEYFIIGGTLLGAIRHKGFIPWDDDMDMGMTYADYKKFLEVAPNKLKSEFLLQHWNDGTCYAYPFAKVRMKNTFVNEKVCRNLDIDKGIWVDIFPYVPISKLKAESKINMLMLQAKGKLCLLKNGYDLNGLTNNFASRVFNDILSLIPVPRKALKKSLSKSITSALNDDVDFFLECDGMFKGDFVFPQEYFDELTEVEFEDTSFMAPFKYHEYLTKAYGDYMVLPSIEERQKGHSVLDANIEIKDQMGVKENA